MILLILGAVVMLAVSIFIHELGHLLCGKLVGVDARIFSIGYGKGLWKKRIGKTIYQITAFPVGGYVLFKGDDYNKKLKGKKGELLSAHPLIRMIPVLGGPFANLVLGFVILFFLDLAGDSPASNKIYIDSSIEMNSPAYQSGLRTGDYIMSVDGKPTESFEDIFTAISLTAGNPVQIEFKRGSTISTVEIFPNLYAAGGRPTIGVEPYGERRVVSTFTYSEQVSFALSRILDKEDKSTEYFQSKWEERKEEIPEEYVKRKETADREKVLRRRAIEYLNDGDTLLSVSGSPVYTISDLQRELGKRQGEIVEVEVDRKTYPLLTPWVTEKATIQIPVLGAYVVDFQSIQHPVFSEFGVKAFSLASYDPEIENRLSNLRIENQEFSKMEDLVSYLKTNSGMHTIWVGNMKYRADVRLRPIGLLGFRPSLKFTADKVDRETSFVGALESASKKVTDYIGTTLTGLKMLFTGLLSPKDNLSGPIGIVQFAGISLEYGWFTYFDFVAKISLALMVMNLLPIPVADGGHIVLYAYEAIAGKPLPKKAIEVIFRVGFFFLLSLGLFVSFNDVMRFF